MGEFNCLLSCLNCYKNLSLQLFFLFLQKHRSRWRFAVPSIQLLLASCDPTLVSLLMQTLDGCLYVYDVPMFFRLLP